MGDWIVKEYFKSCLPVNLGKDNSIFRVNSPFSQNTCAQIDVFVSKCSCRIDVSIKPCSEYYQYALSSNESPDFSINLLFYFQRKNVCWDKPQYLQHLEVHFAHESLWKELCQILPTRNVMVNIKILSHTYKQLHMYMIQSTLIITDTIGTKIWYP